MKLKFNPIASVNNPKSVHGIYPYRGKISAIEAKDFISQMPKNQILLDPFCGSGTIVYEAAKHGMKAIGVDMNPLAITLAEGKLNIPDDFESCESEAESIIVKSQRLYDVDIKTNTASRYFHDETAKEIFKVAKFYEDLSPYLKACFLGAICLTARGCNHYKWTSSTVGKDINPKLYINFYEKFRSKISKHYYPVSNNDHQIFHRDTRELSTFIVRESVDFVYTSPPYFDCLDYTAYYAKIIYEILGSDRDLIRAGLIQNFGSYEENMKKVLDELYEITKPDARVIFVVGDKKIHGKIINGADFFDRITPFKIDDVIERSYSSSSSKVFDDINKTSRKEQIIVWKK